MAELAILIGALIFVVFLVATFANPHTGLLMTVMAEFVRPGKQFPALEAFRLFLVMTVVVLSTWLFSLMHQRKPIVAGKLTWIYLAGVFHMGLSIPSAINQGRSYEAFIVVAKVFIVYLLIINMVDSARKGKGLAYSILGTHVYLGLSGIKGYLANPGDRDSVGASFFIGDANDFAMALTMVLPFAYFLSFTQKTLKARILLLLSGLIIVLATILTFSRGGFIGLSAVLLYCVLVSQNRIRALATTALLVIAVLLAAPTRYWDRISSIAEYQDDPSAMIRMKAWKAGIQMALDHPLTGVGASNFGHAHGLIYRDNNVAGENWNWVTAHSVYFGVLGDGGFVGLALFLFLLWTMFRANRRTRSLLKQAAADPSLVALSLALEASLVAFLICGIFLSIGGPLIYYNAALTVVLTNLDARSPSARPSPPPARRPARDATLSHA